MSHKVCEFSFSKILLLGNGRQNEAESHALDLLSSEQSGPDHPVQLIVDETWLKGGFDNTAG